jgi:tRNA-2-methylthio-N6-dimethylallyladenosine synthase
LIVLNTCSIRQKATEKIYSELGRLKFLKKQRKGLIIAVGGCVSMLEGQNIFRRAPYVDIIFGPQSLYKLPKLYDQILGGGKKLIELTPETALAKFYYLPPPSFSTPSAYISIMEGCNKFCSYCIVPYTRGAEVSRPITGIIEEIKPMLDKGLKEIHLLGQNVNGYRDPVTNADLATLIEIIADFKEIERIRFITSHPAEFNDSLIAVFGSIAKLANHLHLPMQSGSDRILSLMRRGYGYEEYATIVDKVRRLRPDISISTDFIVGFPGETKEDFAATMNVAEKLNFDSSFSFIYSSRPGTEAAKLTDNISLEEKKERLALLQNQLAKQARAYANAMINTKQSVLVTQRTKKDPKQFSGRASNNRVVNFSSSEDVLGKMVEVEITEIFSNSLKGKYHSLRK